MRKWPFLFIIYSLLNHDSYSQMKKEAINQIGTTLKLYKELGINDSDDIDELETMMTYAMFIQ
jgi:hypothetical protein